VALSWGDVDYVIRMVSTLEITGERPVWFVGAAFGGTDDQTERFIREGIWETGNPDRYLDDIKPIKAGDQIALKSTYTRKRELPFDNRDHWVSVMAIKAIGKVLDNPGDGRPLKVEWKSVGPHREWYFYTSRMTVWRVNPGKDYTDELINFACRGQDQNIDYWRNEDYWKDRFGDNPEPTDDPGNEPPEPPYSVEDIVAEGCFLDLDKLDTILKCWQDKKNLILQGPPGTGKTWLAKKLAFALVGSQSQRYVRPLQFHPNLSYEDFVRGWRPSGGDGGDRLELVDGPFLKAVEDAAKNPAQKYVLVIEEINRGNPAQIFGEMLTLLEADKRTPEEALALSYPRDHQERLYIPANLYVIGTMNIADRSLALMDLALRRRFAFVDIEPDFGDAWRKWVSESVPSLSAEFLSGIGRRMQALNEKIADNPQLGPQFQVGHSFVTPSSLPERTSPSQWFAQVVETEIGPLLDEYWFDAPNEARSAKETLIEGLDVSH